MSAYSGICDSCPRPLIGNGFSTGYGGDRYLATRHCFECCGDTDKAHMRDKGKATLYLSDKKITNWPGTLELIPGRIKTGSHNIAGKRYDVWFTFEGKPWHGVQFGDNTQILHCKRIKG